VEEKKQNCVERTADSQMQAELATCSPVLPRAAPAPLRGRRSRSDSFTGREMHDARVGPSDVLAQQTARRQADAGRDDAAASTTTSATLPADTTAHSGAGASAMHAGGVSDAVSRAGPTEAAAGAAGEPGAAGAAAGASSPERRSVMSPPSVRRVGSRYGEDARRQGQLRASIKDTMRSRAESLYVTFVCCLWPIVGSPVRFCRPRVSADQAQTLYVEMEKLCEVFLGASHENVARLRYAGRGVYLCVMVR
jgi:hypothetical protein